MNNFKPKKFKMKVYLPANETIQFLFSCVTNCNNIHFRWKNSVRPIIIKVVKLFWKCNNSWKIATILINPVFCFIAFAACLLLAAFLAHTRFKSILGEHFYFHASIPKHGRSRITSKKIPQSMLVFISTWWEDFW